MKLIDNIANYIVYMIIYPITLFLAMWYGIGAYFDGCAETDKNYPNFKKGIKTGWKSFARVHKLAYDIIKLI